MEITTVTRRNIVDELRISKIPWNGRLDEVSFLKRVFPIQELPTNDGRFTNMAGDIWQHRINNLDWDDDWIFDDPRLNLLECDDSKFLEFLCEMVHPIVRDNDEDTQKLLIIFNEYLKVDGFEIFEVRKISGKPLFNSRLLTHTISLDAISKIDSKYIKAQIEKCDKKMDEGDFDGAITSARTLTESVLGEIYFRCTGEKLPKTGDLIKDYKKVKGFLNFTEEKYSHEGLKGIIHGFNGIIQNIDTLSNKMGDRHRPTVRPERHHAKLVVDSSKTISDFLYSSMEYQESRKSAFLNRLLEILDSEKRSWLRKNLIKDPEIKELLDTSDTYLRQIAKEEFIKHYNVTSFRKSDIFHAMMRIFFDEITVDDIVHIHVESKTNDQMVNEDTNALEEDLKKEKSEMYYGAMQQIYDN